MNISFAFVRAHLKLLCRYNMESQEVIEKLKEEIPKLERFGDYKIYGITHLDIELNDSSIKQVGEFMLNLTENVF